MANLFESASNTTQNPSVTSIYKKNKSIVSLSFINIHLQIQSLGWCAVFIAVLQGVTYYADHVAE